MKAQEARVAFLTNFLPPYRVPLLEAIGERVGALRVLVSTPMERNRDWEPEWGTLDVVVQRTLSVTRTWRERRFTERLELHVPLDTLPQLRAFRPTTILTGELGARTAQAVLYGRATRTPVHIWATLVDHLEVGRGAVRRLLRSGLLPRAAGVIVNGAGGAAYIRQFAVPVERITPIPQTTAIENFTAVPLARADAERRRMLVVGSISERKGVRPLLEGLIELAQRQPERHLELIVAGDGPARAGLMQMPLPSNLRVAWAGHVNYSDLPSYYARAGLLVFPTLGDEWGLVVNEALAAGVPVLGSRYSQAVEELVQDGVNGWIMTPDSPAEIAAAVARALETSDDGLGDMRAAARASIAALTPRAIADRFLQAMHVAC